MTDWNQQWDRVQRLYARFTSLNEGRESRHESSEDYQDDVYAFFVACYHLKDWLKNDPATGKVTLGDVETHVSGSPNLCLCGDLANGYKHLRITSPKADSSTRIQRRIVKINIDENLRTGESSSTFGASYEIVAGSATHDAYEVATGCMDDWRQYLRSKKLMP
jgi:hypothetical protein